jgi:acyl-coenzyme A thioesterase PaaI-like protein
MEPDQAYFERIPWCAELLKDPEIVITAADAREYKDNSEGVFFGKTLKTDDTVRACLTFYKRPASSPPTAVKEVNTLLSLNYGLNGMPHVAHGGLVATIVDEVMGILLASFNESIGYIASPIATADLTVTYLKPVATPQTVLVRARLREARGRKYVTESTVEDSSGTVLAKAKALWIELRTSEKL